MWLLALCKHLDIKSILWFIFVACTNSQSSCFPAHSTPTNSNLNGYLHHFFHLSALPLDIRWQLPFFFLAWYVCKFIHWHCFCCYCCCRVNKIEQNVLVTVAHIVTVAGAHKNLSQSMWVTVKQLSFGFKWHVNLPQFYLCARELNRMVCWAKIIFKWRRIMACLAFSTNTRILWLNFSYVSDYRMAFIDWAIEWFEFMRGNLISCIYSHHWNVLTLRKMEKNEMCNDYTAWNQYEIVSQMTVNGAMIK